MIKDQHLPGKLTAEDLTPYFDWSKYEISVKSNLQERQAIIRGSEVGVLNYFEIYVDIFPFNCGICVLHDFSVYKKENSAKILDSILKVVTDMDFTLVMYTTLETERYENLNAILNSRGFKVINRFNNSRNGHLNNIWMKSLEE